LASLDGIADDDEPAVRSGDGALHEQDVALGVGRHDLEVQRRDLLTAEPAGHARALEHTSGRGARADRSRRTMHAVHAVPRAEAGEAVALHDAGRALALAHRGDVDALAVGEDVDLDLLTDLEARHVVDAQLDERGARVDTGLPEVTGQRLGQLGRRLAA